MFPGEPDWVQLVVTDAVHLGVGGMENSEERIKGFESLSRVLSARETFQSSLLTGKNNQRQTACLLFSSPYYAITHSS